MIDFDPFQDPINGSNLMPLLDQKWDCISDYISVKYLGIYIFDDIIISLTYLNGQRFRLFGY